MSDPRKYRAWHENAMVQNVWIAPVWLPTPSNQDNWQDAVFCGQGDKPTHLGWLKNIPVMQFTGLKDKNGVEIYEGDDVDVSMSVEGGTLPHRGIIVYDNDFGAFGTKNEAGVTLLHFHCLHTLKIIGNIHDKPELPEPQQTNTPTDNAPHRGYRAGPHHLD